jgi:hypothetical protein
MVEGPGATRNGDKARALEGGVCTAACGEMGAVVGPAVLQAKLVNVQSLGKEVFLFFSRDRDRETKEQDVVDLTGDDDEAEEDGVKLECCVRLHFGMER